MSSHRLNTRGHGQRPLLIIVVLLSSLVLIGALGWQSWQLQQSNAAAAASVLRDYGMLAADEFGRRFNGLLGYYGFFVIMERCDHANSADEIRIRPNDTNRRDAAGLASSYFWHDGTRFSNAGAAVSADIETLIDELHRSSPITDELYQAARIETTGEQIAYAIRTAVDGRRQVCGFVVNPTGLSAFAQRAMDVGPLLPASLAGGMVGNDLLFIEIRDSLNRPVFKVNPQFESHLAASKVLAEDPLADLEGFVVRVSIDPESASMLVIGGLPQSRLPWLLAILAMAIFLSMTAIWLFRREQAVMEMREEFVSQVSHELRTPLTQIRMFAETLLLNRARSDDERRRSLEIIDRESQRLSYLVDNVLRASKVSDTIQLDCHEQLLAPIVREVCNSMQSTTKQVTIHLSADESVVANADADAVREILLNLLDNAIKYGPDGQTISVVLADTDGSARLSVEDQGPGIPEVEKDRVWGKFYRIDRERTSAISGTGIGLAVVRGLAEAMSGRCWFDSSNGGARVTVEFPGDTDRE